MMERIWYTVNMAWQHRQRLRDYAMNSTLQSESVLKCDLLLWKAEGIQGIILDVDGVLTPYGETVLSEEIGSWLDSCVEIFGEGKVFILTNKPTVARINYFATRFKGVKLILTKRKKPYPDGIQQVFEYLQIEPKALMVVDDRLLTGILAAIITRVSGCYITHPLLCLVKHPIQEFFFIILRKMERFFIV